MMKSNSCILAVLVLLAACSGGSGGNSVPPPAPGPALGEAIEGLPAPELASFQRGKALFEKRFSASDGLGPYYNAASCAACHEIPTIGGSASRYRDFSLAAVGFPGFQTALPNTPPLPSQVLASFYGTTNRRPNLPSMVNGLPVTEAKRNAPSMFGTGLFEFVSNQTIIDNTDPDDADGDGVSGRFNRDPTLQIGRFGYKCQANNIESFIRGASNNQMGMTTNPVLGGAATVGLSTCLRPQVGANPNLPLTDTDSIPDPELSSSEFADIIAFSKFMAPPRKKPFSESATRGETVFMQIGCAKCHKPTIQSSLGPLEAFTDLNIHDMGPALADGISQGSPQPSALVGQTTQMEFRTQPLWGVSLHPPFMHNGIADTLLDAILIHGGEAQGIRDAFVNLPQSSKDDLIAFLEAL